jgi:hypothetical protein
MPEDDAVDGKEQERIVLSVADDKSRSCRSSARRCPHVTFFLLCVRDHLIPFHAVSQIKRGRLAFSMNYFCISAARLVPRSTTFRYASPFAHCLTHHSGILSALYSSSFSCACKSGHSELPGIATHMTHKLNLYEPYPNGEYPMPCSSHEPWFVTGPTLLDLP